MLQLTHPITPKSFMSPLLNLSALDDLSTGEAMAQVIQAQKYLDTLKSELKETILSQPKAFPQVKVTTRKVFKVDYTSEIGSKINSYSNQVKILTDQAKAEGQGTWEEIKAISLPTPAKPKSPKTIKMDPSGLPNFDEFF